MHATFKTLTIAGHELTLTAGRRYLASRPMARRGMRIFDVSITDITEGNPFRIRPCFIPGLSYDTANAFLAEFNNGETSFEGRIW